MKTLGQGNKAVYIYSTWDGYTATKRKRDDAKMVIQCNHPDYIAALVRNVVRYHGTFTNLWMIEDAYNDAFKSQNEWECGTLTCETPSGIKIVDNGAQ